MNQEELVNTAARIATKLIKPSEGCSLVAYPDPASDLYKALTTHSMLHKFLAGQIELPENFEKLSGNPWSLGFGETKGIVRGMKWTQEEADTQLANRVKEFAEGVLKASPELLNHSAEKLAACTSLAYNIGLNAYKSSSVAKAIAKQDWKAAGGSFALWNKAGGNVMQGLVVRRKAEADLFNSVKE